MKNSLAKIYAVFALCVNLNVQADTAAGQSAVSPNALPNMLIYIQPVEYTSPINLWSPYQNQWFYHGTIVEAQAIEKLSQTYDDVGLCEAAQSAKILVWLQPKMFYNPQVQMLYAEVVANVYTGVGKPVGVYVGESKQRGFLNSHAEDLITTSYGLAIDDMIKKMQADTTLYALLDNETVDAATDAAACSMVTLFPIPTIRVMSF